MTPAPPTATAPATTPRFLVMGCGGIGGILTAHLAEAGLDVVAVTRNAAIHDAARAHGLRLRGVEPARTVAARVVRDVPRTDDGGAPFDFVLLAVQPPQVEQAARDALGALAPDGAMVCLQNGLCEARVAAIAGEARTLGAVVAWGAAMPEPGVYDRTARGGFALGRLDGAPDPRLDVLARALGSIGPVDVTAHLAGKRWSKLALNCAVSSLGTIGGARVGPLLRRRFVRRLALDVMTEVVDVAHREGVALEKVSGTIDLDWIALTDAERRAPLGAAPSLALKHALLLAVGLRYRRMKSSMLSAIERGRTPAVDFLNGEVAVRARRHGVDLPVNERVREMVWKIARGERRPGIAALREIARDG